MANPEGFTRSQALDDMVMGTNSSSIASKRSVERLYYSNEPPFFRYFVPKFQRRAPLINRGYWLRLRAIDVIVQKFLNKATAGKKVIINLGCGSDVLPWQCHARYSTLNNDVLFIDVDYPELIQKKRAIVLKTPELRSLLGNDFTLGDGGEDGLLLYSNKYCQLGCDLRQLDRLRILLKSIVNLAECAILFVAEVSITYMDTQSTDSLINWGSTVGRENDFCLLEQIIPYGKTHPFAQMMLSHFVKLGTPLRSIERYPTVESQISRFQEHGWPHVEIKDLWQAWSSEQFVSDSERIALDDVEPFDEWEEFILFARHYFILHASTSYNQDSLLQKPSSIAGEGRETLTSLPVEVMDRAAKKTTRRRFGNSMSSNSREATYDIFSLDGEHQPPHLPSSGPTARPTISFAPLAVSNFDGKLLSSFGAQVVHFGSSVILCGGMGADACLQGQTITAITPCTDGFEVANFSTPNNENEYMPFMIGSSVVQDDDSLLVLGGGATCFSMGTFWETGVYRIRLPDHILDSAYSNSRLCVPSKPTIDLIGCRKFSVASSLALDDVRSLHHPEQGISMTPVPRIQLESSQQFQKILRDGKPVIFKNCNIGQCMHKWSTDFLLSTIGANEQFVIHESYEDTGALDFNSKNFAYVTDSFGNIVNKLKSGAKVYLRALSRHKPLETPAKLEEDFPGLAEDFALPPEMACIQDRLFSSVLRLSGRVNMWLHYDVTGVRRMVLFPPSDVKHLSFAPGASSSSVDVFQAKEASAASLHMTHPQEVVIHPGDILLLPALWLHTAAPVTDMSVAVNVFFRDPEQEEHYAPGRDVYGNKDLEVYEKGRQAVARIAKSLRPLPPAAREFYLSRIADELRLAIET
ncbi:leucine carboxyl methyltransferase [Trichoderma arundinaceum]|uniref:tRNA wybutosine-synthesizing protein 4 n=1 Tax=Trichoderma arundinaceum TaxID=490622 RepID=A0A395NJ80_TRIAR|nr:leucine carboxyl methyltransferase [Trichoderma arundinaceum]